jgi:hypothetical protein
VNKKQKKILNLLNQLVKLFLQTLLRKKSMETNNFSTYQIAETVANIFKYAVNQLGMDFKTLFNDFCVYYQMDLYIHTNSMYTSFISLPYEQILNKLYPGKYVYKNPELETSTGTVY